LNESSKKQEAIVTGTRHDCDLKPCCLQLRTFFVFKSEPEENARISLPESPVGNSIDPIGKNIKKICFWPDIEKDKELLSVSSFFCSVCIFRYIPSSLFYVGFIIKFS